MPKFDVDLPEPVARRFHELAAELGTSPELLVRQMIERLVGVDEEAKASGLHGIAPFVRPDERTEVAVDLGVVGATGRIRPTGFMWPADRPFPWSDLECAAAVRGYEVKWPGTMDEFFLLRGLWELADGYAVLLQR
jgi:hypothetical protein